MDQDWPRKHLEHSTSRQKCHPLYSAAMPVKPGQAHRIAFDFKGRGGAKVWVRGYGVFAGEKRRCWETFVNCHGKGDGWTTQS